jgi:hypothetical protein
MGHGFSQIFTDKLFQFRLAAEGAVQHRLRQEISLFFSRRSYYGERQVKIYKFFRSSNF